MRGLRAAGVEPPRAGGRPTRDRLHLATVRCIADELDRSLTEPTPLPPSSLRQQLADELERLVRALRESESGRDL